MVLCNFHLVSGVEYFLKFMIVVIVMFDTDVMLHIRVHFSLNITSTVFC